MSDNDDNPEAQNENELAGLDAKKPPSKFTTTSDSASSLRTSTSGETQSPKRSPNSSIGLEGRVWPRRSRRRRVMSPTSPSRSICCESAVIQQRTAGPTDEYATYVGDVRAVLTSFAPILEKSYIEVQRDGEALELIRDELARESGGSDE